MILKIPGKTIPVRKCISLKDRFTSLKFYLNTFDFGLYFPKRKLLNTYFFCQRVDAFFTDSNNKIVAIHENIRSEKLRFHWKAKQLYLFPVGTAQYFELGDTLRIKEQ